jgi:hypothetical protein
MKKINLRNKAVIEKLNNWNDFFFSQDLSKFEDKKTYVSYLPPYEETVTEEFLQKQIELGDQHDGFPPSMLGAEIAEFSNSQFYLPEWQKPVHEVLYGLNAHLGTKRNALMAYYPPGGYIGWHTNWNASALNILFSWSKTGDGWFKWRDPKTGKIHQMDDEPGVWTAKVGYYGRYDEPEHHIWHSAYTECDRFTFSFIIPSNDLWEYMVEDLEDPDA